jgi:hypothetical protein
MGAAKRRGSFEERKAQAIERNTLEQAERAELQKRIAAERSKLNSVGSSKRVPKSIVEMAALLAATSSIYKPLQ